MEQNKFEENEYDMLLGNRSRKVRKKGRGLAVFLICFFIIAGGLAGTYFLFFTPEKRLEKSLSKAESAFSEKDYDRAKKYYKKALSLDDENVSAMLGMLRVYDEGNDETELIKSFEDYSDVIATFDVFKITENIDDIVAIYLFAEKVYKDDGDKIISVYEAAYQKCNESEVIAECLIGRYMLKAAEFSAINDMEKEISCYDKVISLDADNKAALDARRSKIVNRLNEFIADGRFDDADALIQKYKDYVQQIDFSAYEEKIDGIRKLNTSKQELLTSVYEYMSKKDYAAMMKIDGSENANFIGKNIDSACVFVPDEGEVTDYTGVAAAIILFDEEAYYFYYGDFVNGKCEGNGVLFLLTDAKNESYYIYDGEWKAGKPNGTGKVIAYHEYDDTSKLFVTREETGSFKNGMQNGKMKGKVTVNDTEIYTGNWSTKNGVPKDVSKNYVDYPFNVPEGKVLYAVLLNTDKSVGWGSWISKNGHLGVLPFVN